jgi:predicted Zn-dependent peptidase
MISDLPQAYVEYVMKELLWNDQPLGRLITGTNETVTKFDRKTFTNFYKNYYRPENMIVTVAGGTNNEEWLTKIKNIFEKIPAQKTPEFQKAKDSQTKPQIKIFSKKTDQAHLIIGFRSLPRTNENRPTLKILNNILGATMSSRLFIEVREKRGLCYYISSDMADFIDTGFWGVGAGVDIKRIEEALKAIVTEFETIKENLPTDEEMTRAKENLKGHFYLSLEESMNVAEYLAEQMMFWGKVKDPEKLVSEIQSVTKEDVRKLAGEIFQPKNLNLAIVGPFKEEEKFKNIINKMK